VLDAKNRERLLISTNSIRRTASLMVDLSSPPQSFMETILCEARVALRVSRISVWILKKIDNQKVIECIANTDWLSTGAPEILPTLYKKDFPTYFDNIEFGEAICAHDAETDNRTKEFLEPYLKPENIKSMLDTPIFSDGSTIGVVCCEQKEQQREWTFEEVQFAELIADCCTFRLMAHKQAMLEAQLKNLVFLDDLTDIHNRRYFFDSLPSVISKHKRENSPLSIAILDLDNFKGINDNHGHALGDELLKHFTNLVKKTLRTEDIFCRFGGEEFVILFQNQSIEQAVIAVNRSLEIVNARPLRVADKEYPFSFSAGVTRADLNKPISYSLTIADKCLYKAKSIGKNCIETFKSE